MVFGHRNGYNGYVRRAQNAPSTGPPIVQLMGYTSISKARERAIKLFEEAGLSKEIAIDINPGNTEVFAPRARRGTTAPTMSILVYKDSEDKLVTLEMSDLAVNLFYNVAQLSAKEFVKEFAKIYGLLEFRWEIPEKGHFTYWKYESKDGWYKFLITKL